MKNNLKFQLERMYRLMEDKKPSTKTNINEVVTTVLLPKFKVSEILDYFGLHKDDVINGIERSGLKESERVVENFNNLLEKTTKELSEEEVKFVSAILRRLFPSMIKNFEDQIRKVIESKSTVKGFFESVQNQLKTGKITPQGFADLMKKYYSIEINPEAIKIYVDFLTNAADNIIVVENLLEKIWSTVTKTGKSIAMIPVEFWNVLSSEIKQTKIPTLAGKFMEKMKVSYESYDNTLKPLEDEMIKQYDIIMNKITTGKNYDFTTEVNALNNLLEQYRLQKVKGAKTFFDVFVGQLQKEPKFQKLFNPESPFYYRKWWTSNGESDFHIKLMDGYANAEKILPKIEMTVSKMEAAKKLIGGLNPWNKNQKFEFSRLVNLLLTWSPRSFEEAAFNRGILGTRKWIIKGIGQKIVFTVFVLGAWYAFAKVCLTYLLLVVNNYRIKNGQTPYKDVGFITMEDFDLVNKENPNWLAAPTMGLKIWMNSLSFIGSDATKVSFWSPAASAYPYLSKTVLFFLNPKRENLPDLKGVNENLDNEVKTSVADTTEKVNGDSKLKEYTDSVNLVIPTSDSIINKTNESISEIIKQ
jgi:hypothetical protein